MECPQCCFEYMKWKSQGEIWNETFLSKFLTMFLAYLECFIYLATLYTVILGALNADFSSKILSKSLILQFRTQFHFSPVLKMDKNQIKLYLFFLPESKHRAIKNPNLHPRLILEKKMRFDTSNYSSVYYFCCKFKKKYKFTFTCLQFY